LDLLLGVEKVKKWVFQLVVVSLERTLDCLEEDWDALLALQKGGELVREMELQRDAQRERSMALQSFRLWGGLKARPLGEEKDVEMVIELAYWRDCRMDVVKGWEWDGNLVLGTGKGKEGGRGEKKVKM